LTPRAGQAEPATVHDLGLAGVANGVLLGPGGAGYHTPMETPNLPSEAPRADSESESEPRIVSTPGTCGGKPRIAGHRIKVADVAVWYERMGLSPDEIVTTWPSLKLSDVHTALAYYYDHRDQIDADIRAGEAFADQVRAGQPSIFEKVRQRMADVQDDTISS
jgi:uncharacterized protein (DUF433 family)